MVNWPHQSSVQVLVRHFPTREVWVFPFFWRAGGKKIPISQNWNFLWETHHFHKMLSGKNLPAQLETDGQNLIGKGSQHSQQPSGQHIPWWCAFTPCDTGKIELAPNKAEQGFDTVFPQPLQIPQPLGYPLSSAPRNGVFMKSEPIQQEQLCSTDWSQSRRCFRP